MSMLWIMARFALAIIKAPARHLLRPVASFPYLNKANALLYSNIKTRT
jgi:hypothetical protein